MAQRAGNSLDFSAPRVSPQDFSAGNANKRPAAKAAKPARKESTGKTVQPVAASAPVDPYEKARKAQTDYFRRQEEKAREFQRSPENDPNRFGYSNSAPGGSGSGLFGQSTNSAPQNWTNPR